MRFSSLFLLSLMGIGCLVGRADDIPVAPLPRVVLANGRMGFRLQNERLEVVVDPEAGGVVAVSHRGGTNLLRGTVHTSPIGGDLPEPEPLPLELELDSGPIPRWQARGWITGEGTRVVMLTQSFSAPVHMRVTRIVQLPAEGSRVLWSTRMTALAPTDVERTPLTTWTPRFEDASVWTIPADPGGMDETCGPWLRTPSLPDTPFAPQLAVELPETLAMWRSSWELEDSGPLSAMASTRDGDILCRPVLPPDLPPQGWTLVHELTLTLHPLTEDQTACDVLRAKTARVR